MSQVLYRKYRSTNFSELYGQESITRVLRQAVKDKAAAHAYLFTGPRGTGKTSAARILAKALNCLNPQDGEPCNQCSNCKSISDGSFLDLFEIDAASNRGLDEIRDLREKVGFLPAEGGYKVYIIDEVHMLTPEAFNALLKTLEEPPERIVFILATTEAHKLPLTIISRTQRYDFKLASQDVLKKKLEKILKSEGIKVEDKALDLIVAAGNGSFRDAETVLEKVLSSYGYIKDKIINLQDVEYVLGYASTEIIEQIYESIINSDTNQALQTLKIVEEQGINIAQLLVQLLNKFRGLMINAVEDRSSQLSLKRITVIINTLVVAGNDLRTSLLPILTLEVAIMSLMQESEHSMPRPVANIQPKEDKPRKQTQAQKPPTAATKQLSEKEASIVDVKIDALHATWGTILERCKVVNPQMVAMLSKAQISEINNSRILLKVGYAFHKSRLEHKRSREIFSQVCLEHLGAPLLIVCEVDPQLKNSADISETTNSNKDLVEEVFSDMI